jgi:hypothetical protein
MRGFKECSSVIESDAVARRRPFYVSSVVPWTQFAVLRRDVDRAAHRDQTACRLRIRQMLRDDLRPVAGSSPEESKLQAGFELAVALTGAVAGPFVVTAG